MTALQCEDLRFRIVELEMREDLGEGRVVTGVTIAAIGMVHIRSIAHGRREITDHCTPGVVASRRLLQRTLADPTSPNRDPHLDVADVQSEIRMSTEPTTTFGQSVGCSFDFDCQLAY